MPSSPGADGHILLAQDNPIILRVVALLLQKLGYNVDLAHNGPEAVALASATNYDLILIGCRDAIDTVAQIRHNEGLLRHTAIITIITNQADWDRCKEAGADDFLTIPVNLDPLRKLLARWLTGAAG